MNTNKANADTANPTPAVPVFENLTLGQKMGVRCVVCNAAFNSDKASIPVGQNDIGSQVFACEGTCSFTADVINVMGQYETDKRARRTAAARNTETGQEN